VPTRHTEHFAAMRGYMVRLWGPREERSQHGADQITAESGLITTL